jgi:hypothetical protein
VTGRVLLATVLVVSATTAPSAHALPVRGELEGGPRLAGDEIAWAEHSRGRLAVRLGRPGEGAETLFRSQPAARMHPRFGVFAASAGALVFDVVGRPGRGGVPSVLRVGSLRGPYHVVERDCIEPAATGADAEGTVTAVAHCAADACGIRFEDVASGAVSGLCSYHLIGAVSFAGTYLAFEELDLVARTRHVIVYDRSAGAEAFRVALSYGGPEQDLFDFDIQADGKLALLRRRPGRPHPSGRLEWYSPAEPSPHRLAQTPLLFPRGGGPPAVRIAGDRIAFDRWTGAARHDSGRYELAVASLSGTVTTTIARFAPGRRASSARVGDVDFDGSRVSWGSRRITFKRVRRGGRVRLRRRSADSVLFRVLGQRSVGSGAGGCDSSRRSSKSRCSAEARPSQP